MPIGQASRKESRVLIAMVIESGVATTTRGIKAVAEKAQSLEKIHEKGFIGPVTIFLHGISILARTKVCIVSCGTSAHGLSNSTSFATFIIVEIVPVFIKVSVDAATSAEVEMGLVIIIGRIDKAPIQRGAKETESQMDT